MRYISDSFFANNFVNRLFNVATDDSSILVQNEDVNTITKEVSE